MTSSESSPTRPPVGRRTAAAADEIVVINEGRVEQIGSPDELYDEPANDFVMRFLGPVTQLGQQLVRPHDLGLSTTPVPHAVEGRVDRLARIGFEVRVEVTTADQVVLATATRPEVRHLGIEEGSTVWLQVSPGAPTVAVTGPPPAAGDLQPA